MACSTQRGRRREVWLQIWRSIFTRSCGVDGEDFPHEGFRGAVAVAGAMDG